MSPLDKAKKTYLTASDEQKRTLEDVFGKEPFHPKITDLVKTTDDVFRIAGVDPKKYLRFDQSDKNLTLYQKSKNATDILELIVQVLSYGQEPDYTNTQQVKYEPIFEYKGPSVGWVYNCYGRYSRGSSVGSRLVYLDLEVMKYAVVQFKEIYNLHLSYTKWQSN
jgi:hypothetical protein